MLGIRKRLQFLCLFVPILLMLVFIISRRYSVEEYAKRAKQKEAPSSTPSLVNREANDINLDHCLEQYCIETIASKLARAFPTRSNRSWATPEGQIYNVVGVEKSPANRLQRGHEGLRHGLRKIGKRDNGYSPDMTWTGILHLKMPKAASSTGSGVALRIALPRNLPVQYKHVLGHRSFYKNRIVEKSFLFTSVRDPAKRKLSWDAWSCSVAKGTQIPEDRALEKLTQTYNNSDIDRANGRGGHQLSYASLRYTRPYSAWDPKGNVTTVINPRRLQASAKQLLLDYDFILLVERMEESLVAMSLVMGVSLGDVLVASSAKVAGASYFLPAHGRNKACMPLFPYRMTAKIKSYIESNEWRAMNYGDYLLHAALNQSLDRTIDETIGRAKFESNLEEYRRLSRKMKRYCEGRVHFPCTTNGQAQPLKSQADCYLQDFGCGHPCMDEMLELEQKS